MGKWIWIGCLGIAGLAALSVGAVGCRTAFVREVVPVTPEDVGRAQETAKRMAETSIDPFTPGSFTASNGITLPYRLLAPADVRPEKRYPLILSLHGSGQMGEDNVAQVGPFAKTWAAPEMRSRFPVYLLAPQFPTRSALYSPDPGDGLLSSEPGAPLRAAMGLLDSLLERLPIDPDRVYVVGFSMGASSAWNALLLRPGLFAAAIPIAGVPPPRALAPQLASANLLVIHGTADTENPPGPTRAMVAALESAGARSLRFREYEGLEHEIPPDLFLGTDWREWLLGKRRGGSRQSQF